MVGTFEERQLRSYQPEAIFHQHQREILDIIVMSL